MLQSTGRTYPYKEHIIKHAFSPLCCLDYSLQQVLELCQKSKMEGVELRFDAKKLQEPCDYQRMGEAFHRAGIRICDIAHVHLKDGIPVSGQTEFFHTDLGAGQMPFGDVIRALKDLRYDGFLSLEWESLWRPEIRDLYPDPLVLLNKYTAILRQHGS